MEHKDLLERIAEIQQRWNFNPAVGAKQARDPEAKIAYATFRILLREALKSGIAEVPYDPAGLDPLGHRVPLEAKPVFVYFLRVVGTDILKIGRSVRPYARANAIQTGNDNKLEMIAAVPASPDIEQRLLRMLAEKKTRDRHRSGKCEWVTIDGVSPQMVKDMVASLMEMKSDD